MYTAYSSKQDKAPVNQRRKKGYILYIVDREREREKCGGLLLKIYHGAARFSCVLPKR